MTAVLITAAVCASYAAFAALVVRAVEAERLTPRWWRRLVASLRRAARAVRALTARTAASLRLRWALTAFSLHFLLAPKGVSHR